jgi:hypothetical protein
MLYFIFINEPGSSVSIVSDYGLHVLRQRQEIFSLMYVPRPALGPTQPPVERVLGILSPGVKGGLGVTLTTHPHLVPRSWMSRSYTLSSRPAPPRCVVGLLLFHKLLHADDLYFFMTRIVSPKLFVFQFLLWYLIYLHSIGLHVLKFLLLNSFISLAIFKRFLLSFVCILLGFSLYFLEISLSSRLFCVQVFNVSFLNTLFSLP